MTPSATLRAHGKDTLNNFNYTSTMIDDLMQIFGFARVDPPEPEPDDLGGHFTEEELNPPGQEPDPDYTSPFTPVDIL